MNQSNVDFDINLSEISKIEGATSLELKVRKICSKTNFTPVPKKCLQIFKTLFLKQSLLK